MVRTFAVQSYAIFGGKTQCISIIQALVKNKDRCDHHTGI